MVLIARSLSGEPLFDKMVTGLGRSARLKRHSDAIGPFLRVLPFIVGAVVNVGRGNGLTAAEFRRRYETVNALRSAIRH